MKEELDKLAEILAKVTGSAVVAICIYLLRSPISDFIITGGVVTCVYLIAKIWY